jgi:hypothetical protein
VQRTLNGFWVARAPERDGTTSLVGNRLGSALVAAKVALQQTPTAVLHLHAQNQWHEDAHIVGNREGLLRLREAIAVVLDNHASGCGPVRAEAYAADGEAYNLFLIPELLTCEEYDRLLQEPATHRAISGEDHG